jgi:hypothetical protein
MDLRRRQLSLPEPVGHGQNIMEVRHGVPLFDLEEI